MNLYRELYDPEKDLTAKPNKLLSMASEEDKQKLKNVLNKYSNMDTDEIKDKIANLKSIYSN